MRHHHSQQRLVELLHTLHLCASPLNSCSLLIPSNAARSSRFSCPFAYPKSICVRIGLLHISSSAIPPSPFHRLIAGCHSPYSQATVADRRSTTRTSKLLRFLLSSHRLLLHSLQYCTRAIYPTPVHCWIGTALLPSLLGALHHTFSGRCQRRLLCCCLLLAKLLSVFQEGEEASSHVAHDTGQQVGQAGGELGGREEEERAGEVGGGGQRERGQGRASTNRQVRIIP